MIGKFYKLNFFNAFAQTLTLTLNISKVRVKVHTP